jgi:hypothetical protein
VSAASLFSEKAPYIITLFVAALGWTVNQTVSALTDSPTIAYKINWEQKGESHPKVACTVKNVTRTKQFKNLQFILIIDRFNQKGQFDNDSASIDPISPSFNVASSEITPNGQAAHFDVPLLQPGWAMELSATATQELPVNLQQTFKKPASNDSASNDSASNDSEVVRMVPFGIETWIVEHEIQCLIGMAVLWLASVTVSIIATP